MEYICFPFLSFIAKLVILQLNWGNSSYISSRFDYYIFEGDEYLHHHATVVQGIVALYSLIYHAVQELSTHLTLNNKIEKGSVTSVYILWWVRSFQFYSPTEG